MSNNLKTIRELITRLEELAREHGDVTPVFVMNDDKPTRVVANLAVLTVLSGPGDYVSMRDLGGTPPSLFPDVVRVLNAESAYKHVLAVRVY